MTTFTAFRIHQGDDRTIRSGFESITLADLNPGEVTIRVAYSGVNYKDALAATGAGRILRRYPMVGGIDLAGHVESSTVPEFAPGQAVVVCGGGLSETLDGGYTEIARVPAAIVVPLPAGLSPRDAMGIGTAGFTAALALARMEDNGQTPAQGPIVITGATGGVGSYAIDLLANRGYEVLALTGKPEQAAYLKSLGATDILDRGQVEFGSRPLEAAQWGGAVDNLGGDTLAWLTRTVKPWGCIASIGLAAGHELHTTVMPFILRGISLLGIDSVGCPHDLRLRTWQRLGGDLRPQHIDTIVTREVAFGDLPQVFQGYVDGSVTGRTVVAIGT